MTSFQVTRNIFLVLALALASLTAPAKEVTVGKLKYKVNTTSKIARCTGLATPATKNYNLTIPSTITYGGTTLKVISVEDEAFWWDNHLKSVKLSDYTETIGTRAFSDCSYIRSISLGNSLKTIKAEAFHHAGIGEGGLTTIEFPRSVETVGEKAFSDCRNLTSVSLNRGLRVLDKYAFWGCVGLTSITLPGSLQTIGYMAFASCENLEEVTFTSGDGRGTIGEKCFDNLKKIKRVSFIGENIETIGRSAFINCRIEWLSFPPSLRTVEIGAFDCNCLSYLHLNEGLQTIGAYAFSDQKRNGVENLTIPSTVTSIGDHAFNGLNPALFQGISYITCNAVVPPVCGKGVFCQNTLDNAVLNVPAASLWRYRTANVWKDFAWLWDSGVDDIEADSDDPASYRYFNLSGIEVDKAGLAPGIYIRVNSDGKSEKISIR